jgi:23S rRNA (adenine2503-C2)-methyltransferase
MIEKLSGFTWANNVRLQISLHAWPSEKRLKIIPMESHFPINKAIESARLFALKTGRQCCLNIVLIADFNDAVDDAIQISKLALSGPFYVKISELNPNPLSSFSPASNDKVNSFGEILKQRGVKVKYFKSIGSSIGVGCGQTRLEIANEVTSKSRRSKGVRVNSPNIGQRCPNL